MGRLPRALAAVRLTILALGLSLAAPAGAQSTEAATAPAAQRATAATAAPTRTGGLVVPAGTRVTDDIIVLRTPIDVYGVVDGDVITMNGNVTVHPGGRVNGDALSAFGTVRIVDGGAVAGTVRSLGNVEGRHRPEGIKPVVPQRGDTWHAIRLVLGWLTVLLVIGLGVLVTASPYLDGVAEAFEGSFARALGVGIVGQMLMLPALLVLVIALTLTLVGVLAIPLAVVASVIAVAGLVTLGFLAVAFVTGRSILGGERGPTRRKASSARGEALAALSVGLGVYLALWVASAAFTAMPAVAVVLRTVALATTWVAATAGFGAALISRAGTRSEAALAAARASRPVERSPYQSGVPGWQTPTPVSGVVAARRPTTVPRTPE